MNWMQFTMWVLSIYLFYYGANFSVDFFRFGRVEENIEQAQKVDFPVFEEAVKITNENQEEIDYFIDGEPDDKVVEPPVYSSGGVSLKDLFSLARSESIEYTNAVSF